MICLSEHLSGTYSSACLGKKLYEEEYGEKNICVLSSDSASAGELNLALYIRDLCEQSVPFQEIEKRAAAYRDDLKTYFVLESLDYLRKNGRLTGIKSFVASALNIKPVMGSTPEGTICQLGQARGMKRALVKMTDQIAREGRDTHDKLLAIAHCNCLERAREVERMLLEKIQVKGSFIVDTAGISTMYANDGGIIVVL